MGALTMDGKTARSSLPPFSTSTKGLPKRDNSFMERSSNRVESVMIDHHENDF
jgi:hypothetical protein